ncbi:IS1182 family transposase [Granulosicoccus sp.]|nr:IS1182 family transposase [Granulosicoccus sp.]MDB4224055.1 IS1182 family transposase [Granulosicoccus sp.]
MSGFIKGENRRQATLFPERLDDYITEENSVRVIDVFVDSLKLKKLGFATKPKHTGRPGYEPALMLKLYVYGYLNRIQSSRRLERESQRNVELMWLLGRLTPDFKTIADFRKDNGDAIKQVCCEFVLLCKRLDLLSDVDIAVDGSKFKAQNNGDRAFSKAKIKRSREKIEKSIGLYLDEIKTADREDTKESRKKKANLKERLAEVEKEAERLKLLEAELLETADQQIALTDPDARIMATRAKGSAMVGYNVQSAVDTKNHLIIAHEVTNVGNDRSALFNMANHAKQILEVDELEVLADRGYYSGQEIKACEDAGIKTYLPKTHTSNNRAAGLYDKSDFIYDKETDTYRCPADQVLKYRGNYLEGDKKIARYYASYLVCAECPLKEKCTKGRERRVSRWEHEEVLERLDQRMEDKPGQMGVRRSTVEHPFGTIKNWMGHSHFQMITKPKVSIEMSLHVLCYNLRRVISIMGVEALTTAIEG